MKTAFQKDTVVRATGGRQIVEGAAKASIVRYDGEGFYVVLHVREVGERTRVAGLAVVHEDDIELDLP
jgi:hypothetical protein